MSTSAFIDTRELAPLVSVVIPTKGRPVVVQRAVTSVLRQSFTRLEVIVIVDGNDQETVNGLNSINDPRVSVVTLEHSVGAAEARNTGVRTAVSEWIAFLDDDDEWLPEKIERQFEVATQAVAELPVICSAYIGRSLEGDIIFGRNAPVRSEPISEYMFCRKGVSYGENALATSVLFVSRKLMLRVPFDAQLRRHQDWDWALRALNVEGAELYYIAETLGIYYMPADTARMSGHVDWKYSLQWCRDRRALFTPKAFSFFLTTECLTRARQANAGAADLMILLSAYCREGQPTWRSALLGLSYLLISKKHRRLLLKLRPRKTRV